MINKLLISANNLIAEELERANAEHPLFASRHEGYAVLLEEVEELQQEQEWLADNVDHMWKLIKKDQKITYKVLRDCIRRLIAEAVQVGAMIDKMEMSERAKDE